MLTIPTSTLPAPSEEALLHSQQLALLIRDEIRQCGGWLSFAQFMQMALYTPKLGYYSGGAKKFGMGGDFITAPEISPLFAKTLAYQVKQILQETKGNILELGAGTGRLATDMLHALQAMQQLPERYYILDVSAHLRRIQLETMRSELPSDLVDRVVWLDSLPDKFTGLVLGNEVLDAVPVNLVYASDQRLYERGVAYEKDFFWQDKSISEGDLFDAVSMYAFYDQYLTEASPQSVGLIHSLARMLDAGVILMLDYGFPAHEYYHPQRNQGTLMCHYQHYAHGNPFINIGLQDITSHVDFTRIAQAGLECGLQLQGFCSQAQFLMNCGILNVMSKVSPHNIAEYAPLAAAAQKLLSPAEMGDLFKVIALAKKFEPPLLGFVSGDKSHTL